MHLDWHGEEPCQSHYKTQPKRSHLSLFFVACLSPLFFGVNGFGGVLNAFSIPRMNRSSAPGSSSISVFFLDGLTMSQDDPGKICSGWPNADMFGVSAAHLHALGAISLTFNRLESAMSLVFTDYLKSSMEIGEAIFHRLNNNQRIDILRQLIDENPDEAAESQLIPLRVFYLAG